MSNTRLSKERTPAEWNKEVAKIEKKAYRKDEARKLYAERKLKDGVLFALKGCMVKYPGVEKPRAAWAMGTFVAGKLMIVHFSENDTRLPRLKRQAVARLMQIAKTGMVNTRQATHLPHRYQSAKNPSFTLFGADSKDDNFEGQKFKKDLQVFDQNELIHKV